MKSWILLFGVLMVFRLDAAAADQWKRFVPPSAPAETVFPNPAYSHTAVWTGSEMMVWGGLNNRQPVATGGRLAVATNSWTALPATGAPSPRSGHTAVWTGSEMIIWGGYRPDGSRLNDGARYSVATHSWRPLPLAGAPSPRNGHTAVWTGSEMVVWGGAGPGEEAMASGARYNPASNTWIALDATKAPGARFGHTAVWTGEDMVIWGGARRADASCANNGAYCTLGDGAHYSPATDSWAAINASGTPEARFDHTVVWTGTEMIVWGGRRHATGVVNTGARYNPMTRVWLETPLEGAPSPRLEHTAVWTGADMIVWGGGDAIVGPQPNPVPQGLNTGARYSPSTNTWSPVGTTTAPGPRRAHAAVWTGRSMIVSGGWNTWTTTCPALPDCGTYLASNNNWGGAAPVPGNLENSASVWTGQDVFVQGDGTDWRTATKSYWRYLPALRAWAAVPSAGAPAGRKYASVVWTGTEVIVWGGLTWNVNNPNHPFLNAFIDGGRFDPSTHAWTPIPAADMLAPRTQPSAVWTGTELIIWGGYLPSFASGGLGGLINDGARYAPATNAWQALPAAGAPGARQGHVTAWTGTEMIVWGGWGAVSPQGARYRPATNSWVSMKPLEGSGALGASRGVWTGTEFLAIALAGDPANSTVVGGRYSPVTDTWSPMNLAGAPVHAAGGFAVWSGTEMIVWGWNTAGNSSVSSGARYNPTTDSWTPMTTTGSPSTGTSAIWDGTRLIVFGDTGGVGAAYYTPDVDADLEVVRTVNENGTLALTFSSALGRTYTLWQTDSLLPAQWVPSGEPTLAGTGSPLTFTVPAPPVPGRYFRVQGGP